MSCMFCHKEENRLFELTYLLSCASFVYHKFFFPPFLLWFQTDTTISFYVSKGLNK